jgi:hypothetical protein
MRNPKSYFLLATGLVTLVVILAVNNTSQVVAQQKPAAPEWSFNSTLIEACSCSMFCP